MKNIYLDYASSSPVREEVKRVLMEDLDMFAHPSSQHLMGMEVYDKIMSAKSDFANTLLVKAENIEFVPSATLALDFIILGLARFLQDKSLLKESKFLFSKLEHPANFAVAEELKKMGAKVEFVSIDKKGRVLIEDLRRKLDPKVVLVSVSGVNSELGTAQDIKGISKEIKRIKLKSNLREALNNENAFLHSDMGLWPLYFSSSPHGLGLDFANFDSNKLYGPKGICAVYMKRKDIVANYCVGARHKGFKFPGTPPYQYFRAFALAMKLAKQEQKQDLKNHTHLRSFLIKELKKTEGLVINNDFKHVVPNLINISFPGKDASYIKAKLSLSGIHLSSKTACKESEAYSKALLEVGASEDLARSSLRLSFGKFTSKGDLQIFIDKLNKILHNLPQISN